MILSLSNSAHTLLDRVAGRTSRTPLDPVTEERISAVLRAGRALAIVAVIGLLIAHFTNALLLDHQVPGLDANHEGTPLTWASGLATGAVAIAALVAAVMTGPFLPLLILGLSTAFLSMDDMIALHERLAAMLVTALALPDTWDSLLWPALYLPLMLVTAVLILRMTRSGTVETFRMGLFGLGMLAAAVVIEVVTAPWSSGTNLVHTVQGGIEEALELGGWVCIATAAIATLLANVVRQATAASRR